MLHADVRYWHIADVPLGLTNVRFGGKADIDQPLLTTPRPSRSSFQRVALPERL